MASSSDDSVSEPFLSEVERVRIEIRDQFSKSHQMLHEREAALLSELDKLVASYRGEGVKEQIQELNLIKESMKSKVQRNENQETVVKGVAVMDDRIRELEESFETTQKRMSRALLEWDGELEGRLGEIGGIGIIGQLDYMMKDEPVITAFKHSHHQSNDASQFHFPCSLTIENHSRNIYVCDSGNHRVQVFSKSLEFLFQFIEKMNGPVGICISENKVYVTQYVSNCLNVYSIEGELLQSVGKKGEEKLEFDHPCSVEVSTVKNLIYICENNNNRIQCLNLNLDFNSFILYIWGPKDIKLTQNEIVVLKKGYHCICLLNYSHQVVREMIRCGEGTPLTHPQYFCIDQQNNILMTDISSHCVAIFSIRGDLIRKFGKEGEDKGEFIEPTGIVLDSEGKIVVISQNKTNCIQLFSF